MEEQTSMESPFVPARRSTPGRPGLRTSRAQDTVLQDRSCSVGCHLEVQVFVCAFRPCVECSLYLPSVFVFACCPRNPPAYVSRVGLLPAINARGKPFFRKFELRNILHNSRLSAPPLTGLCRGRAQYVNSHGNPGVGMTVHITIQASILNLV